ncbi:hypothetical protein CY34DRAFT_809020 [Suillus luteus UH-Slu-Lm8-n1]|uniref:Unplaced genomic scaffold CY34scaffold_245, whole genome shotgun sequence n=1 Tax=Suillus luteus UH-Slu-Lm8-n1 TaxID=930992 RepID=A0A0D0B4G2_9AGAM|nr:hypothetical protein CY34DRAFT_809020 [Suillus luteus UH-Slu-Lm8-n1]
MTFLISLFLLLSLCSAPLQKNRSMGALVASWGRALGVYGVLEVPKHCCKRRSCLFIYTLISTDFDVGRERCLTSTEGYLLYASVCAMLTNQKSSLLARFFFSSKTTLDTPPSFFKKSSTAAARPLSSSLYTCSFDINPVPTA